MQDPRKFRRYRTSLHNKLENIPDMNNINKEWEKNERNNKGCNKRSYTNTE